MLKAVLFDLDGTIIDTVELIRDSFRYATKEVLGLDLPDEALTAYVGQPLLQQMEQFSPEKADELMDVYRAHNFARHDTGVKRYPGIREMLKRLHEAGLRLGIVTSKGRMLAERGLEVLGLAELFDELVSCDECTAFKPDAFPVRLALERMGLRPDEAMYIGDSPFDILSGNAAGVLTVAVLWGAFTEEQLRAAEPDIVIDEPADILGLPGIAELIK